MAKKKKRLRIGRLFLLLIIIGAIFFACYKFVDIPILSVNIKGNEILTDDEILKESKLDDYPSYFSIISLMVKKDLKKNPYIKDAKVSKGLLNVNITITEEKVLYIIKETNEKVMLSSKVKDDKIVCAPYLTGTIPSDKEKRFKKAISKIDKDMLCQISEIKHDPNEIDEDRYFVYMNDGNKVYLTINKFDKINKYNKILENIGRENGTLYLDYGDYYEAD